MKSSFVTCAVGAALAATVGAGAQTPTKAAAPAQHVMVTPGDVKWGPVPPFLAPGAQMAVLDGNPGKPGFFSVRLRMPDGYKVAPHWHPTDENIVVIQGEFLIGAGDTFSESAARDLPVGSFTKLPRRMHHFAGAKGETIVQIYGQGPFVVNYVHPEDDPRGKTPTK
ncbi:MAG: cupin domain-containing protein [Betaproteobacteria bacterium]